MNSYLHHALQSCNNNDIMQQLHVSSQLLPLWKSWEDIVGEPITSYIYPIGTKHTHIIVGTHDSSSFQEMHYYKDNLLARINAFLQKDYFTDVIIQYSTDAISLVREANTSLTPQEDIPCVHSYVTPQNTLPPTSIVAKAYQAFLCLTSQKTSDT